MSRLNVVIGADIKQLETNFNKAVKLVQDGGKEMSADVAKAAKDIQDRLGALANAKPTARVVRQLQTMAMEARAMGPEFAAMANEFIVQAGRMQDEISDTRAEIGYFASDTRRLDAVIGGAQAVAAGFGVVEGSMAALGMEGEDLQKTMAKIQGMMLVLNSLQSIQNALQAESALSIGLSTAAAKIQTYVMGQATIAARLFAGTMATLGIGAVVALLGGLAYMLTSVEKETKSASKAMDEMFEKRKKDAEEMAGLIQSINDAELKTKIENAKRAGKTEKELRDLEINFLDEKIAKQKQLRDSYKIGSLERNAIGQQVAAMEVKREDLITENIVAANAKRIEARKAAAEKEKEIIAKALESYTFIYNRFGFKAAQHYSDGFGKKLKSDFINPSDLQGVGLKLKNTFSQLEKDINKKPVEIKIDVKTEWDSTIKALIQLRDTMDAAFESMIENTLIAFGEAIGGMLAGEEGAFKDFGKTALAAVAQFMKAFGTALVTTAIASDAFQKLILANPIAAAAAGVALVAGSAIITAQLKKGPEFTAFADGGIVYGPTLGLMGEYPGARSNPEVIAPLDKLRDMISPANGDGGYIASTHISGRDLAIVLNRHNNDYSRG
jgi:predicted CopG family antitoxin